VNIRTKTTQYSFFIHHWSDCSREQRDVKLSLTMRLRQQYTDSCCSLQLLLLMVVVVHHHHHHHHHHLSTLLSCCSSLTRRRLNLAVVVTLVDARANIASISLVRASSDVTRDVIRDVTDAPPSSATSVSSCQLTTHSNVSNQSTKIAVSTFELLWCSTNS